MLNKILSKKIKSTMSLRGAFSFCHSRESGNPSSLSLRGAKQRSNLKGFSLIELMVAVVILSIAIFGIFHAYSVGFMGMVGARERTVATNYAQEAMEDVKNMAFEKITTSTKSVISSNKKYRVDVNVSIESTNLKKVYTVVSWKDRNGIGKTVETTMLVNFIEVFASEPAKIVLYADSYTILNTGTGEGTFTGLTAVIKDIKGNTIIDWDEGDITFSIFSGGEFGILSPITVTPDNGIAKTTFSSSGYLSEGEIGYTVIKASVNLPIIGNVSDQVTIKVTDGPVKIILVPNPGIIKAGVSNYSTVTVSLCNAVNQILKKSELVTDIEITFSVFGEGNLSTSTITIPAISEEPASAEIILNSTGTPGLASIVATAVNLESGIIDVRFLGSPVSILISANPNPIYVDDLGGSTITVTLLDINGFATNPNEGTTTVTLALSTATNGSLSSSSLTFIANDFEGIPLTTLFSGQTSAEAVTITASEGGLTTGSVTINILSALVPDHINLAASPLNVKAGGLDSSTITATVYDNSGKIVTNYTGTITFATTLGTFSGINPTTTTNGVATIELSYNVAGTATITVSSSDSLPSGGVEVIFYQETTLTLVENSAKYSPTGLIVTFKVNLIGENILLDEMKVSWTGSSASQRFNKIVINSEQVYTGNDKSDTIVDIIDKTLLAGESIIELTFGQNMAGKTITVTFYPYIGSYEIFFIPTP